ncbi:MAG: Mu-like prophage major head subunit gpT family protein [Devosia sp.]
MPETIERRAGSAPRSFNPVTRTFTAIITTPGAVEGIRVDIDGMRVSDDVPVQLDHQTTVEKSVGRVVRTWREGDRLLAEIQLSDDPSLDWLVARIADGTVKGVSIGFRVTKWGPSEGKVRVAEEAELIEVSITPFPADKAATIRSDAMEEDDVAVIEAAEDTQEDDTISRSETRRQMKDLRRFCRSLGLSQDFADDLVDDVRAGDLTEDQASRLILDEVAKRAPATIRSTHNDTTVDNPDVRVRAIGEALYTRSAPDHQPSDAARGYIGQTVLDIARDCLSRTSVRTTGLSQMATIERALHTTSDFPLALGEAANRSLRAGYSAANSGLKLVGRRTTARDFRDKHLLQLSEGPQLEKVNEAGEFTSGTIAEAQQTYRLATFGKIIGLTRQALVNDDLGAFTDLSRRIGQGSIATEAALLVALLEGAAGVGPTMSDGKALFHADHGNLASSATTPDVPALSAARQAMREQVGLTGELISVTPRYLIVPPALETLAEQVLASITPTKAADHNPFSGTLQLVVEPRLTDPGRWYISAAPSEIDGLEYAYLEGEEGPQTETRAGFEVDGVQVKVRLDFGAGFVDHRSWFQNPGA